MIKGLAITPPVIGRISIGRLVCKNDKWLPEKDDSFTLTTQIKNKGEWLLHPLHQKLSEAAPNQKIRAIPVRMLFNDTDLNLRAEYSAFDRQTGRPLCVGDGEKARRVSAAGGTEEQPCAGPQFCPYAREHGCKLYGRLNVQVDGQGDELASFIFRTTGYNSVRTLAARLRYFEAVSGGNTKHLPLMLKLRAKSTTQSHRAPVFYVDLTLRHDDNLADAVAYARSEAQRHAEAGVETERLEEVARQALLNGVFEDSEDEAPAIVEEFFPEAETATAAGDSSLSDAPKPPSISTNSPPASPHTRPNRVTPRLGQPGGSSDEK